MSAPSVPPGPRRLLVALDASPQSLAALAAAADLAARAGAGLEGLFVEDVELLHLAGQACARLVDARSAASRGTDADEVARALRALAARARRALAECAARADVPWTFRIARGRVAHEILAAAASADLVYLGCAGWAGAHARLGATARAVACGATAPVVLVRSTAGAAATLPVVLDDGSPAADRAFAVAADLAARAGGRVLVFAAAGDDAARRRVAARLAGRDTEGPVGVEIVALPRLAPADVAHELTCHTGAFLVLALPAGGDDQPALRVAASASAQLVVVR